MWVEGDIPDGKGRHGVRHNPSTITASMFQCFDGDISAKEIMGILDQIKYHQALLKKDKKLDSVLPTMKDLATSCKIERKLKSLIVGYYVAEKPDEFAKTADWDDVLDILPDFADQDVF